MTTDRARRYGRGPKGERVHGAVPLGRWQSTTVMGAWALAGLRAAMTVDAATETDVFLACVSEVLCPVRRPDDWVIWDNLAPHKDEQVEAQVAAVGARAAFATVFARFQPHRVLLVEPESAVARSRGPAARHTIHRKRLSKDRVDENVTLSGSGPPRPRA